jgi:hypothetical protein
MTTPRRIRLTRQVESMPTEPLHVTVVHNHGGPSAADVAASIMRELERKPRPDRGGW